LGLISSFEVEKKRKKSGNLSYLTEKKKTQDEKIINPSWMNYLIKFKYTPRKKLVKIYLLIHFHQLNFKC
jgi:hypothetical protein